MRRFTSWALVAATLMVAGWAKGQPAASAKADVPFFVPSLEGIDSRSGRKAVATEGKRLSVLFIAQLECSTWTEENLIRPQGLGEEVLGCKSYTDEPHLHGVAQFGIAWTAQAGTFPNLTVRYGNELVAAWDLTVLPAPPPPAEIATHEEVAEAKVDVLKDVDKKLDDYGRQLKGWSPLSQRAQFLMSPLLGLNDQHATNVPVGVGADILVRLHRFAQLGATMNYVHTNVWTFDGNQPVNADSVEEKFSFTAGPYVSWAPLSWLEGNLGAQLGLEVVSYPDTFLSQSSTKTVEFANQATNYVFVVEPCANVLFHPAPNLSIGGGVCGVVNATPYNRVPGYDGQDKSWGIEPQFKPIMVGLRI